MNSWQKSTPNSAMFCSILVQEITFHLPSHLLYFPPISFSLPFYIQPCCAKLLQSCPTLCDPMDYSLPGSSVHGILQARILEWVAVPSSRGSSGPRDRTHVSSSSCMVGRFFMLNHQVNSSIPSRDYYILLYSLLASQLKKTAASEMFSFILLLYQLSQNSDWILIVLFVKRSLSLLFFIFFDECYLNWYDTLGYYYYSTLSIRFRIQNHWWST